MFSQIPNTLTCLNLLCGCFSIVFIFKGEIEVSALLTLGSLVFDFLDGFAARAMKASSTIGKELDSLADVVSFGLVPGLIGCHLCLASPPFSLAPDTFSPFAYFPLIITIASAIRLARFNVDTRQTDSFIGVPTPAITILMMGLALVVEHDSLNLTPTILNPFFICGLSMVIAWLLNSELPLLALKFKSYSYRENSSQYLLIISSILSIAFFGYVGIPLTIVLYIVSSVISKPVKI
ncbi:MAG: CDP-diacylglycerol--serine O-phosphatidyltransferase [Bacteroidota bacterium]|jgi:CDP-diacylglycerol--serine O-phosphatidyltransferase